MIEGIEVIDRAQIHDERGKIMHMLRSDDPFFRGFGEIYFSCVHPGVVKGWHLHSKMTLCYAVPQGKIKLVLFDDREGSSTQGMFQELILGPETYRLVIIPPGIWNGFRGIDFSIVANCADLPHDPAEIIRRDPDDPRIGYDWRIRHG